MNGSYPQVSDSGDSRTALVEFLLGQPTAIASLLGAHTDDGSGRCRVCTAGAQRGYLPWPCTLHTAARHAGELWHGEAR